MNDSQFVKDKTAYQVDALYAIQTAVGNAHSFNPDDVQAKIVKVSDSRVFFEIANHESIGCDKFVKLIRDETVALPENWK